MPMSTTEPTDDDRTDNDYPTAVSDGTLWPNYLRDHEVWVVWTESNDRRKTPCAPWVSGYYRYHDPDSWEWVEDPEDHADLLGIPWSEGNAMFEDAPRPETDFETASKWTDRMTLADKVGSGELWVHSDSDGIDRPHLGLLDGPNDVDLGVVLFDFDSVRDPETGEVLPAAWEWIARADSWTEISQSGEGLHVFVRAHVPGEGKPEFDLDGQIDGLAEPHVEVYSPPKFVALTGDHVAGTPEDVVKNQQVVDELLKAHDWSPNRTPAGGSSDSNPKGSGPEVPVVSDDEEDSDDSGGYDSDYENDYWDHPLTEFAMPDPHNYGGPQGPQGCHPAHAPLNSALDDADHYQIYERENTWACYHNNTGGKALDMVYVMESPDSEAACNELVSGVNVWDLVTDPEEFLDLCLAAKNDHGFRGKPPYRALVGLAKRTGIPSSKTDLLLRQYKRL